MAVPPTVFGACFGFVVKVELIEIDATEAVTILWFVREQFSVIGVLASWDYVFLSDLRF
jgi:hypothetical protein